MIIGSMLDFFRWISRRPLRLLHAFGAALGWLTWALSPSYRRRFAANARRAGLDPRRVRPAIAEAGRMVGELPFLWLRPAERALSPLVRWEGAVLRRARLHDDAGSAPGADERRALAARRLRALAGWQWLRDDHQRAAAAAAAGAGRRGGASDRMRDRDQSRDGTPDPAAPP